MTGPGDTYSFFDVWEFTFRIGGHTNPLARLNTNVASGCTGRPETPRCPVTLGYNDRFPCYFLHNWNDKALPIRRSNSAVEANFKQTN